MTDLADTRPERLTLPVLPLRDVVVFPHMVIPLFVGRDKSIRALDLAMEGVELEIRQDALAAIAKKALKRKTGARGLRTIVESVLLDTMYELPSLENVSKVVVDESVIEHKSEPYLIYQSAPQQPLPKAASAD